MSEIEVNIELSMIQGNSNKGFTICIMVRNRRDRN